MNEKLGTTIIDGKLIDLDKTSIEELKKIKKRLEERERKIRQEIEELLAD